MSVFVLLAKLRSERERKSAREQKNGRGAQSSFVVAPVNMHTSIRQLLLVAVFALSCYAAKRKKIPDYLHVCHRNDPNLEQCIRKSVEELRPYLRVGIPEMQVPPIEPLFIKELVAAEGSGIKVVTEDLKVYGCSNFTVLKLNVDLPKNLFEFNILLPHLVLDGRYIVDGRILLIPIKGKGGLRGDIYNAKANVTLVGELVKRKGVDYLHYNKMVIKIKVGSGRLQLDNLFGGEPVLGQIINTAINANFDQFINELRPIIEKALSTFMLESAEKIVSSFPYDELFPLK